MEEMGQKFLQALLKSRDDVDDVTPDIATATASLEAKRSSRFSVDSKSFADIKYNPGGLFYDYNNNHYNAKRHNKVLNKANSVAEMSEALSHRKLRMSKVAGSIPPLYHYSPKICHTT